MELFRNLNIMSKIEYHLKKICPKILIFGDLNILFLESKMWGISFDEKT